MVCYNCPGAKCECVTSAELRELEFTARMTTTRGGGGGGPVTREVGRTAIPVRRSEDEGAGSAAACTPATSVQAGQCMDGDTAKIPGSDKGQLLPADCAALCEKDSTCSAWSCVPSTVPAGLRQWQGCYASNSSWDGGRIACPFAGDSSGCSSRGVAKHAAACCPSGPLDTKKYWLVKNSCECKQGLRFLMSLPVSSVVHI
jgi:hypothetical protein